MAEKPVPTEVKLGSSALFIPQACLNCKHFKHVAHPAYEKTCMTLGVLPESRPCERFSPNPSRLKFEKQRHARQMIELMRDMTDNELATAATMFMQERRNRKYGYRIGDTVYLLAFGADFLSNYRRAKVVSADLKYIHIHADQGFSAMVYHDSVMNAEEWKKKKLWLINNERLQDPRYSKYIKLPSQAQVQAAKILQNQDALDLDFANGGPFMEGATPSAKRSARTTELTELIVERRPVPTTLRIR